jgi:hypothetical protein
MYFEHIIYSSSLAILIGMFFYRSTGRDSSWIIILCSWVPDLDHLVGLEGAIHNLGFLVIFTVLFSWFLLRFRIQLFDGIFFSAIGYGAHLVEDALAYPVGYRLLLPFSRVRVGFGVFPDVTSHGYANFFGIANTEVLLTGLFILLLAIIIRTVVEGPSWIRWYMPDTFYLKLSGIVRVHPAQP